MTFIPIFRSGHYFGEYGYGIDWYGGAEDLLPWICLEADITTNPVTDTTRIWTDLTPYLRQLTSSRSGRNDELQRTSPGTITISLNNQDDAITSLGIKKDQWIRYRAQWDSTTIARWQGVIGTINRQWPAAGGDDIITIQAGDVLKVLNLKDLDGETFTAQRNDERIVALATLANLATSSIDTDTDDADAITDPISQGTNALSVALDIEASENGLLIAEPDGTVSFQGRHWRMLNGADSIATLGENAGEIPYRDSITYVDDDSRLANSVAVTTAGGSPTTQTVIDGDTTYFSRRLNRTLQTSDASIALDAANYLLERYKNPSPRIPAIEIDLAATALRDPSFIATLLGAGNSDRLTWSRDATTPISDDVYIEQISETITPGDGWRMTLQLSPADDESGWVLGDSVLGVLGTTTRLVY